MAKRYGVNRDSTGVAAGVCRAAEAGRESGSVQSEGSENGTGGFSGVSRAGRQASDQLQRRSGIGARREAAAGTEVHYNNRADSLSSAAQRSGDGGVAWQVDAVVVP